MFSVASNALDERVIDTNTQNCHLNLLISNELDSTIWQFLEIHSQKHSSIIIKFYHLDFTSTHAPLLNQINWRIAQRKSVSFLLHHTYYLFTNCLLILLRYVYSSSNVVSTVWLFVVACVFGCMTSIILIAMTRFLWLIHYDYFWYFLSKSWKFVCEVKKKSLIFLNIIFE